MIEAKKMIEAGKWSFIGGIILAVVASFFTIPYLGVILLVLGLIVGFLNISKKEVHNYLISVIALLIIGVASISALAVLNVTFAGLLGSILTNFIAFVSASGLVVAIKAIVQLGKD